MSQRTEALSAEVVAATQRAESVEASAEALALAATAAAQNGHVEQADAHAVRHLANFSSLASGSHLGLEQARSEELQVELQQLSSRLGTLEESLKTQIGSIKAQASAQIHVRSPPQRKKLTSMGVEKF